MNKSEFIAYLQGIYAAVNPVYEAAEKDFNGTPITKFDGAKWCTIQVKKVDPVNNTAIYKNVHVYVTDEGQATESVEFKEDMIPPECLPPETP